MLIASIAHRLLVVISLLAIALFLACAGAGNGQPRERPAKLPVPKDVSYTIIKEETFQRDKRSLDVRLNKKVSELVLEAIAINLKNADPRSYERTFIVYYLPGMKIDAGGWATTHFRPGNKLEIRVMDFRLEDNPANTESVSPNDSDA